MPSASSANKETRFRLPINDALVEDAVEKADKKAFHLGQNWVRALESSYLNFSDACFAVARRPGEDDYRPWRTIMWEVFASIPARILKAAIDGSLPSKVHLTKDPEFVEHFEANSDLPEHEQHAWILQRDNDNAPAVYARYLVDSHGLSLTVTELLGVVATVRDYIQGDAMDNAVKIDCLFNSNASTIEDVKIFQHFYLAQNENRVIQAHVWCHAVEKKCSRIPLSNWDLPYPKPLTYCGYAQSIKKLHVNYNKRESTSWLVLLVEAALKVKYPDKNYGFKTYAMCFFAREEEVQLSERSFTACLEANYWQGGFCVAEPGQHSIATMPYMSENAKKAKWEELMLWRHRHTPFPENREVEADRATKLYEKQQEAARRANEPAKPFDFYEYIQERRKTIDPSSKDFRDQMILHLAETADILRYLDERKAARDKRDD